MKELLEEAMIAIGGTPDNTYGGKYGTLSELYMAIKDHLKIQKQIDAYSSEMFTQLKLKL